MKKIFATVTLISALTISAPLFAQSSNDEDIKSDVGALNKDNAALNKDQSDLAKDRAAKAADKANGNYGKQAVDSMAIGGDKTATSEKETEKDADKKILVHHKKKATQDTGDAQTSTNPTNN